MGKRKLHGETFYQCDYTGLPMQYSYCYMPTWDQNGKLVKKGSYCNWESVLAHAATDSAHYDSIRAHVVGITGTDRICKAPAFTELQHFGGSMTAQMYHERCTLTEEPVMGVKIDASGEIYDVMINPNAGKHNFEQYLHKPYSYHGPPQMFHTMRKKVNGAKDLSVLYYPSRDLPSNTVASNVFKMQIHGDVLMIQQSKEQSFMPRQRYVTYTRQEFVEQFMKKRKRGVSEAPAMSTEDYEAAKSNMQTKLQEFEAKVSKDAKTPGEFARSVNAHAKKGQFRHLAKSLVN